MRSFDYNTFSSCIFDRIEHRKGVTGLLSPVPIPPERKKVTKILHEACSKKTQLTDEKARKSLAIVKKAIEEGWLSYANEHNAQGLYALLKAIEVNKKEDFSRLLIQFIELTEGWILMASEAARWLWMWKHYYGNRQRTRNANYLQQALKALSPGNKAKGLANQKRKMSKTVMVEVFARMHHRIISSKRKPSKMNAATWTAKEMNLNKYTVKKHYENVLKHLRRELPEEIINLGVIVSLSDTR